MGGVSILASYLGKLKNRLSESQLTSAAEKVIYVNQSVTLAKTQTEDNVDSEDCV